MRGRDTWNAGQYEKFRNERSRPYFDLMDLVDARPGMVAIDLGCGTGALTALSHERFQNARTVGLDNSPSMLETAPEVSGVEYRLGDIAEWNEPGTYDLVLSNAALQWVPDHAARIEAIVGALKPGGQLALQIPDNGSHPSQQVAYEMEREGAVVDVPTHPLRTNVLPTERYAEILDSLGIENVKSRTYVYLHRLESREAVVEWVKGTFLLHYKQHLDEAHYESFLQTYRERLFKRLPDDRPFRFTFRRIFLAGRKPA